MLDGREIDERETLVRMIEKLATSMASWPFRVIVLTTVFGTVGTALVAEPASLPAEPTEAERLRIYESGPLTPQDFQAPVPVERDGLDAWTTSELKFRYGYETQVRGRRATARITHVDVDAVVVRDQSWNRLPHDEDLMDHEQGHFDLTQIAALEARLYFARQRLVRTAATPQRATEMVEDELNRKMQEFIQESKLRHDDYDQVTNHGRTASHQQEQRLLQQQQLERLTRQWQDIQQAASRR